MRHCSKCGVSFTGDLDLCPLCQAELSGAAEPAVFPSNEVKRSGTMALRVLAFATGAAVLAAIFVGQMLGLTGETTLAICLALLLNYAFVRHILSSAPDFLRLVARYFLVLLGIAFVWFLVTRQLAITTYVIPSICLVALVFDAVLVGVFRGTFVAGYAKYLLFDIVFGLAPLALVAAGWTTWNVLAYLSALVASVFALALVVFLRPRLMAELRKLFTA